MSSGVARALHLRSPLAVRRRGLAHTETWLASPANAGRSLMSLTKLYLTARARLRVYGKNTCDSAQLSVVQASELKCKP